MVKQLSWIDINDTEHLASIVVRRIIAKIDKKAEDESKAKKQMGEGYFLKPLFNSIGYHKDLFTGKWYISTRNIEKLIKQV